MFSGLSWTFPMAEVSQYARDNMALIMPLLVLILGVLFARLIIDSLTDAFLKVAGFVVGGSKSHGSTMVDDDDEPD
jgi:hypothetical protein